MVEQTSNEGQKIGNVLHYVYFFIYLRSAFRSRQAKLSAQKDLQARKKSSTDAAILIQTYFRMWHCQTVYQQLLRYKEQKELQLIYFGEQVSDSNMLPL